MTNEQAIIELRDLISDENTDKENEALVLAIEKLRDKRPQGEREFIEILAQDVPDDLCTYLEYRGKPYYSIHFKENGEDFVGFGTYKPEVLSRYLREYFMNCGADTRKGGEEK